MTGKKILLVEDDPVSLKLMRDVLQAGGYETSEATSGEDGIAMARDWAPDLIVMDIRLPGMDGVEAARTLKSDRQTRATPIIAVTAHAMSGDEARIREAGYDAYLPKPLHFAEFVTTVRGLLADA